LNVWLDSVIERGFTEWSAWLPVCTNEMKRSAMMAFKTEQDRRYMIGTSSRCWWRRNHPVHPHRFPFFTVRDIPYTKMANQCWYTNVWSKRHRKTHYCTCMSRHILRFLVGVSDSDKSRMLNFKARAKTTYH
jgi:hypothetical protein